MPHLVAAPDKFRGTATAGQVAAAIAAAARSAGWTCDEVPMADGGEGTLDALGGRPRRSTVHDPLGRPVSAEWRMIGSTAVIEMAQASGLALVGGPAGNDPVRADTAGTGELIAASVMAGARRVIVGVGGSASTDGGLAALAALEPHSRLHGVQLVVACDVRTRFLDAAAIFSRQKGASPSQAAFLSRRLERLAQLYQDDLGVDVRPLLGGGAAGGLAGGLGALGAELVPGFAVVAEAADLGQRVEGSDLVITGEGIMDEQSFDGKVVGGVVALAAEVGVPVLIVAGEAAHRARVPCISLVERFGWERALNDSLNAIEEAVADHLAGWVRPGA